MTSSLANHYTTFGCTNEAISRDVTHCLIAIMAITSQTLFSLSTDVAGSSKP